MQKFRTRWLDRRIGAAGPYLALCLTQDEFDTAVRHLKLAPTPFLNPGANATMHEFEGPHGLVCIVCLGDTTERNGVEIAGLLVHEAVHVWQHWCDDIGEDRPGREQEAYGVQAIAQELFAEYARRINDK